MGHYLSLILLGATWGASFLFMRIAVPAFGPIWLIQFRVGIAALFISFIIVYLKKATIWRGHIIDYAVIGLLNLAVPFVFFSYSAQYLSASILSIINATAPFWAAIFAFMFVGARLTRNNIIGLVLGFIGVMLIMFKGAVINGDKVLWAMFIAILAPVCYGLSTTYITKKAIKVYPLMITLGTLWAATLMLLPFSVSQSFNSAPRGLDWFSVISLGVLCTGVAYVLFYRLLEKLGTVPALTVVFLVPFFGTLWGVVFLDEPLSWQLFGGGALILLGVAFSNNIIQKFRLKKQIQFKLKQIKTL